MCGICGKLQFDPETGVSEDLIDRMTGAIAHRGPDGVGKYVSGPVGLGHTRLAIIDLSTGDQPMPNEDKTIWLVFNGEIYNFRELREDLLKRGHQFRSATDTEVIVHLYEEYGVECVSHLRGMFAFALWDERQQSLFLVRDRVGIKPLYYANLGKALVFGSEIKALLADPDVTCEIELQSVDKFLTHLCLPGRETLWKGIYKLEPGNYLFAKNGNIKIKQYWDLHYRLAEHWDSIDSAAEELYGLMERTVEEHMISDVPVGFLLSGGVDSTAVLSCAAKTRSRKLSTFTVGFDNASFEDERVYARLAASRYGTDHHEITLSPREFWDFLPSLVWHMEEPVCDPPAVSLHYVSKLARQHVKVLLSGEGGDEAFGGYYSYKNLLLLEEAKTALGPFKGALAFALSATRFCGPLRKLGKYSPYAGVNLPDYYYSRAASPFSFFNRSKSALYTADFEESICRKRSIEVTEMLFRRVRAEPLLDQMQYIDLKTSLPDDLLIKADRMTMANSLELRVPFLDHKVLEFAATLPARYRVKGMGTKLVLKRAFRNQIPDQIIRRRKAGFPLPINTWIRHDLRANVREILMDGKSLARGYFRRPGIEKLLSLAHQGQPLEKEIFSLLTLELLQVQFSDKRNECPAAIAV
jgi:asparagine synthase (glutamine-hydrolysing)